MESFFSTIGHIPSWVNTLIIIILGGMYVYRTWRNEAGKINKEIIEAYEKQVEQFKEEQALGHAEVQKLRVEQAVYQAEVQKLRVEQATFQATLTEKNLQIEQLSKRYDLLVQNRNPDLVAILNEVKEIMHQVKNFMQLITLKLEISKDLSAKNHEELLHQTDILESNQKKT